MHHGCSHGDCEVKIWDLLKIDMSNTKILKFKVHNIANKHSESIANAIQVPYRPNKFSRGISPTTSDQRGQSDT